MKYIREFIKKIPDTEFQKLINSSLTETERLLILEYKNDKKEDTTTELCSKLNLKESTLKKLQSSLLIKSLEKLSSKSIFDQSTYLSNCNCHRILLHLSKKEITKLKKEQNTEVLKKLIKQTLYNLLSAILTDYTYKDLDFFEKEYLKIEDKNTDGYKQFKLFRLILELYQIEKLSSEDLVKLKTEIDKIKINKNDIALNFWKNKLLGDYYQQFDEEKYMNMLKVNYDLLEKNKISLPLNLEINTYLPYCFYLIYNNRFEETYHYYKQMMLKFPEFVNGKRGLRYIDLISQVCIVLGKYEEAKKYIFSAYPIEKENPGKFSEIYFGNATVLALINILESNHELAYHRIQAAKAGLKKQYFIFLDSLLRIVEQAYYLKVRDYDYADTLHKKNIKFYQYHKNEGLEIMFNAHKILNAYAKMVFDKKELSTREITYLKELKIGEFAFIGHFIDKLNPKK